MVKQNALRTPETDTDADEWLSALFDGELNGDASKRAVARIGKDADSIRRWSEYSLIGDVMRGCPTGKPDLSARIRAALAEEPTVLAPMPPAPDAYRPYYWAAAAAAAAAIAWTVLSVSPQAGGEPALPVAVNGHPDAAAPASNSEVQAYLAAHQDYAYAVSGDPEMRFTKVSLVGDGR